MARQDSEQILAQLRASVSDSNLSLGTLLDSIVRAAQRVACADGAAIAMRRGNLVVCQARSGDMAPELGSELDADSHISGQCLRTGGTLRCDDTNNDPRVDAEACRSVGLRSVAVVAVGKEPAVSGVLEAFSSLPNAFDDTQVQWLEEMAELVAVAQRRSAESVVAVASEKPASTGKRSLRGSLMLAVVVVVILLSWLVLRVKLNSHPLSAAARQPVASPPASAVADSSSAEVLKPNPSPVEEPRSATPNLPPPMVKASETERDSSVGDVSVRKFAPAPVTNRITSASIPDGLKRPPVQNPDQAAETPPALSALSTSSFQTAPSGLFAGSNYVPKGPMKVSQGLTGGTLEQQVNPIYPSEGLAPRIEGPVVLQAVVTEDGTVRDLKVLKGHPLLARAAIQAVSQWRYRPYLLDGQPIRMTIEITLIFKHP